MLTSHTAATLLEQPLGDRDDAEDDALPYSWSFRQAELRDRCGIAGIQIGMVSPDFLRLANGLIVPALKCRTTRFSIRRDLTRSYEGKGTAIV
jgi:hypothetical protein